MGGREKDQADFDLDRFVDMFDEAMTSKDPRVIETLRSLMMITALTRPEARNPATDRQSGPLRRMFEDMRAMNQRMARIDDELRNVTNQLHRSDREAYRWEDQDKYTMASAQKMALQIDADVLAQMRAAGINKVNGLK